MLAWLLDDTAATAPRRESQWATRVETRPVERNWSAVFFLSDWSAAIGSGTALGSGRAPSLGSRRRRPDARQRWARRLAAAGAALASGGAGALQPAERAWDGALASSPTGAGPA